MIQIPPEKGRIYYTFLLWKFFIVYVICCTKIRILWYSQDLSVQGLHYEYRRPVVLFDHNQFLCYQFRQGKRYICCLLILYNIVHISIQDVNILSLPTRCIQVYKQIIKFTYTYILNCFDCYYRTLHTEFTKLVQKFLSTSYMENAWRKYLWRGLGNFQKSSRFDK